MHHVFLMTWKKKVEICFSLLWCNWIECIGCTFTWVETQSGVIDLSFEPMKWIMLLRKFLIILCCNAVNKMSQISTRQVFLFLAKMNFVTNLSHYALRSSCNVGDLNTNILWWNKNAHHVAFPTFLRWNVWPTNDHTQEIREATFQFTYYINIFCITQYEWLFFSPS